MRWLLDWVPWSAATVGFFAIAVHGAVHGRILLTVGFVLVALTASVALDPALAGDAEQR